MKKNKTARAANRPQPADALSKSNVRDRIKGTRLRAKNDAAFQVERWKEGDEKLPIKWKLYSTILGEIVVASTGKGVCFIGFGEDKRDMALRELKAKFPLNVLENGQSSFQWQAVDRINYSDANIKVHLHLKGTEFQLTVWEKLLRVPFGGLITYGGLAEEPGNARAVGNAVGANPVCLIVGCHRVVRSDGGIEGFHYGNAIKKKLLAFEAARREAG